MLRKNDKDNLQNNAPQFPLLVIFFLMLGAIAGIVYFSTSPVPIIIAVVSACVIFAFLTKEPNSLAWISKIEIEGLKFFRLNIDRQEKQLYEMPAHITPKKDRPHTSIQTNKLLDEGKDEFIKENYQSALNKYQKIDKNDPAYWFSRSNVLLCLVKDELFEQAEIEAEYIAKHCTDKKYLAWSLINISDYYMRMSLVKPEYQEKALNNYLKAFEYDSGAITSLFYCWVAKTALEEDTRVLAHLIKEHKDYETLQFREYFEEYDNKKMIIKREEFIMSWKKVTLTAVLIICLCTVAFAVDGGVLGGRY